MGKQKILEIVGFETEPNPHAQEIPLTNIILVCSDGEKICFGSFAELGKTRRVSVIEKLSPTEIRAVIYHIGTSDAAMVEFIQTACQTGESHLNDLTDKPFRQLSFVKLPTALTPNQYGKWGMIGATPNSKE